MEIQPSRQHQPDRFGPLSPRIAPGPDGLERQPVGRQLLPPAAHAAIVRDALRETGLVVWTDEGLEPGTQNWRTAIEEAIRQSKAMVALLSPNANVSVWVDNQEPPPAENSRTGVVSPCQPSSRSTSPTRSRSCRTHLCSQRIAVGSEC